MSLMAKETLASLKAEISSLTTQRDQNAQAARLAVTYANEFATKLFTIETLLNDSPFIQKGWFKKVWWVLSNWKQLVKLIEDIMVNIKAWREYFNQIQAANTPPSPQN